MSATNTSPQEFRLYRRLVTWFVLAFIGAGTVYLMASVGISIYRRRSGALTGALVSAPMTLPEMRSCFEELADVAEGLQKHLEKFHYLLSGYDPEQAQRWGDEGAFWRNQWAALGKRCRFEAGATAAVQRRELDQMVDVHQELGRIELDYTKELVRFGRDQAPRLTRVRDRMKKLDERLSGGSPSVGDNKP